MDMLADLNMARRQHGIHARGTHLYGVEMYGLNIFQDYLEGLDGVLEGSKYVFLQERNGKFQKQAFAGRMDGKVYAVAGYTKKQDEKETAVAYESTDLNLISELKRLKSGLRRRKSLPLSSRTFCANTRSRASVPKCEKWRQKCQNTGERPQKKRLKMYITKEQVACEKILPLMQWRQTDVTPVTLSIRRMFNKLNQVVKHFCNSYDNALDTWNIDFLVSPSLSSDPVAKITSTGQHCLTLKGDPDDIYSQIHGIYEGQLSQKPRIIFESPECSCDHPGHAPKFTVAINTGGKIIAAATIMLFSSEFVDSSSNDLKPTVLEIEALAVKPEAVGKGYGSMLLVLLRLIARDMKSSIGTELTMLAKSAPEAHVSCFVLRFLVIF
uniref:N-acetyltransferase domain-containing protein n=2 Tax=Aplanochytrium stocchinoi TaxID=215587 RepID=A0A6S8DHR5_9STRA